MPSATRPSQLSSETSGFKRKCSAESFTRAQCSARSGVTPSKARAPSNTIEPSQAAWVRGPMIGTLPSCQSPSKNVQVLEKVAAITASSWKPILVAHVLIGEPASTSPGHALERQRLARRRRPVPQVETVRRKQGEREAIDAEGDAGRVRESARLGLELPGLAEMVLVVVEAHAGGRRLLRAHRNEQLELQGVLDLVHRHQLGGTSEERIARGLGLVVQAEQIGNLGRARHPLLAEGDHLVGRADAHELAHAEALEAVDLLRRLVAEAVARDVEQQAGRGHAAARGDQRIEGITGGGREHEV